MPVEARRLTHHVTIDDEIDRVLRHQKLYVAWFIATCRRRLLRANVNGRDHVRHPKAANAPSHPKSRAYFTSLWWSKFLLIPFLQTDGQLAGVWCIVLTYLHVAVIIDCVFINVAYSLFVSRFRSRSNSPKSKSRRSRSRSPGSKSSKKSKKHKRKDWDILQFMALFASSGAEVSREFCGDEATIRIMVADGTTQNLEPLRSGSRRQQGVLHGDSVKWAMTDRHLILTDRSIVKKGN